MAVMTIQFEDKEQMTNIPSIPAKNKCTASDLNEIKQVVNNNANEIPNVNYLQTEQVVGIFEESAGVFKNIYRKVITIPNIPSKTEYSVSFPNCAYIIDLKGSLQTNSECYPVQYYNVLDTALSQVFMVKANNINANTLNVYAGTTGTARIFVDYVKKVD